MDEPPAGNFPTTPEQLAALHRAYEQLVGFVMPKAEDVTVLLNRLGEIITRAEAAGDTARVQEMIRTVTWVGRRVARISIMKIRREREAREARKATYERQLARLRFDLET